MKCRSVQSTITVALLAVFALGANASPLTIDMPSVAIPVFELPEMVTDIAIDAVNFDGFWEQTAADTIADATLGEDATD